MSTIFSRYLLANFGYHVYCIFFISFISQIIPISLQHNCFHASISDILSLFTYINSFFEFSGMFPFVRVLLYFNSSDQKTRCQRNISNSCRLIDTCSEQVEQPLNLPPDCACNRIAPVLHIYSNITATVNGSVNTSQLIGMECSKPGSSFPI